MKGLFGKNIRPGTRRSREAATRPLRYVWGLFGPALDELENSLETYKTNEPINEKEGNKDQAALERKFSTSIGAAIRHLKKAGK